MEPYYGRFSHGFLGAYYYGHLWRCAVIGIFERAIIIGVVETSVCYTGWASTYRGV